VNNRSEAQEIEAPMTIVYIDTEHDLILKHPEHGPCHRARIETTRSRLAVAAGQPCLVQRFAAVSPDLIQQIEPSALVFGGNRTDWAAYDSADLDRLLDMILAAPVPILGICAGHQLIGRAHGAGWGPLGALQPGEIDPDPLFAPGQRKEHGFLSVEIDPRCPLFRGLPPRPTFFQFHYWQLVDIPAEFDIRAHSPWSTIQAIERRDRPVFGVQFHPERYDSAYPDGATVLRNFFTLSQVHPAAKWLSSGKERVSDPSTPPRGSASEDL
jgi:GMP synthase (glutamine-hydrolysing)